MTEPTCRKRTYYPPWLTLLTAIALVTRFAVAQPSDQLLTSLYKKADSLGFINADSAHVLYKKALAHALATHSPLVTRSQVFMARNHLRLGQVDSARWWLKTTNRTLLLNDPDAAGEYHYILADIFFDEDKIELSSAHYDSALAAFRASGNRWRLGKVLNAIGVMYDYRNSHTVAIEHYNSALSYLRHFDDFRSIGGVYNNLAGIYTDEEQSDVAFLYYDSAELMYKKAGHLRALSMLSGNKFLLYLKLKEYAKALQANRKAMDYAAKANDRYYQAYAHRNYGYYYFSRGDFKLAEEWTLKARATALEVNNNFLYRNAMEILIDVYDTLRQYKNAYDFTNELQARNDSTYTRESTQRLKELELQYETEKKEKELAEKDVALASSQMIMQRQSYLRNGLLLVMAALIAIAIVIYRGRAKQKKVNDQLQKTNAEIEKQKLVIEQNLREKEGLLREIHHRVKNNLQVISSLLNMQSYHLDDPGMISAIAEGQSRVKAMALIHQKLYQTEQLTEIDFEDYTQQLLNHLATAFGNPGKKIHSKITGGNIKLDIDTAIPLGLIMNELVTNAYKYAFTGVTEGDLRIELQKEPDQYYSLTVADSGQGLPKEFDETKLNSLGLKLVKMLIEQLDGSLTIQSEKGTKFHIRFRETRISA